MTRIQEGPWAASTWDADDETLVYVRAFCPTCGKYTTNQVGRIVE